MYSFPLSCPLHSLTGLSFPPYGNFPLVVVVHPDDDLEELKEDCQSDLTSVMKSLATDTRGVMVHASTLGALEALLQFLREVSYKGSTYACIIMSCSLGV